MVDGTEQGVVTVRGSVEGFAQEVTAGSHRLIADEPLASGRTDGGPGPYDLLLSALGACTSMTIAMYARRKGWQFTGVTVRLRHSKIHADDCADCETQLGMLDRIEREIAVAAELTEEPPANVLGIADKCPVQRTLTSEINIRTTLA